MSDPGSIVGAVSLLLQSLQEMKKYYSNYRNFNEDIVNITVRIQHLEVILSVIEKHIQSLWRDDDETCNEVKECIVACDDARKKLELHLQKCDGSLRKGNSAILSTRLLYPFRRATLEDLQKQLDRLLNNLQTVMHAFDL